METTKLSSKGQVIIPKDVRARRRWTTGQEFDVVETDDGVLLRPHGTIPRTRIEDIGTSLRYRGPRVPDDELDMEGLRYSEPYASDEGD